MTSSKKIIPDEVEPRATATEDGPPAHSHLRRWSSPAESGGAGSLPFLALELSLAGNPDYNNGDGEEHQGLSGVNLDGFFTRSRERRYSFYLGTELSRWGPLAAPLLGDWRATAAAEEQRRRERTGTIKEDLPPLMTTLYSNGRPRFLLMRRVMSDGRLVITRVAVRGHELVMYRGREGLRIGTVRITQEEEEEEQSR